MKLFLINGEVEGSLIVGYLSNKVDDLYNLTMAGSKRRNVTIGQVYSFS
ncbi:hypothetical protein KHA80_09125 [Anaerobacillus sp. HL2]|nr:hypothetical protein KHA80_09125 [Anaerobacillus sp. HL2]